MNIKNYNREHIQDKIWEIKHKRAIEFSSVVGVIVKGICLGLLLLFSIMAGRK
jgi:hypothetical protein